MGGGGAGLADRLGGKAGHVRVINFARLPYPKSPPLIKEVK
jgi:hypothetical protein